MRESAIADAIRAYTYNTAYANFEEKIKGSIEVGKFADLTVLSRNLLRMPNRKKCVHVLTTVVSEVASVSNSSCDERSTHACE